MNAFTSPGTFPTTRSTGNGRGRGTSLVTFADAGAVNVQLVKDTSTDAPGAGTDLLTNNTDAGFNCKGTANTVQNGTLTATTADATTNESALDDPYGSSV